MTKTESELELIETAAARLGMLEAWKAARRNLSAANVAYETVFARWVAQEATDAELTAVEAAEKAAHDAQFDLILTIQNSER